MLQVVLTNTDGNFSSSRMFQIDNKADYDSLIKMSFNEATLNEREQSIIADTRKWFDEREAQSNLEQPREAEAGEQGVEEQLPRV